MTLNTVVAHAYGFNDYRMCGIYLNRARIIVTLIFIPLSLFLLQTERVFDFVGFDPKASYYSQLYINLLIPGLFFLGMLDSNRRYLNNLGYQNGPMYIQLTTTALHFLWCYLLIDVFEWGAAGAGVATSFTHFLTMIGIYIYTETQLSADLKEKSWFMPWHKDFRYACFEKRGLIDFFKQGIPSTGMLCLEWWAFEIMILFSAFISIKATAAQVITLNTAALFFMPTIGL